jgi:predicted esterase
LISVPRWLPAQTARERNVPWLAEVQQTRPPVANPAANDKPLAPLLVDEGGREIRTVAEWELRRQRLLRTWSDFLGLEKLPRPQQIELTVLAEDRDAGVLRRRIRYEVEPGWVSEAYWLEPQNLDARAPAAVALHSTVEHSIRQPAGLAPDKEQAFALQLAQRGFVCIAPRNYLWPTNDHIKANEESSRFLAAHPGCKGMAKMLLDAQIAVDLLARSPHVDSKRIACVGHSLGAKEVLYLAAFDPRIVAAVSSEGGIGKFFSNWDAPWYLGSTIKSDDFVLDHHELLAATAPRPFLLIGGDSADGDRSWPYVARAMQVYQLYNKTPPLGLYNHKQGHAVPPECGERILEWITTYTA